MMEDLANADMNALEAEAVAPSASFAPLLTNYTLNLALDQTNPIRLQHENDPGYETPHSLFMIYLQFESTGKLVARQLRFDDFDLSAGGNLTLDQAEAVLLGEARAGQGAHPQKNNFQEMTWQRPYYITFVIDNAGWRFYWDQAQLHEAIRFLERKDEPGNFKTYEKENYSFFDAKPHINLGLGDAFRVTNYYRDENGTITDPHALKEYCFQIYLQTPFKDPAGLGQSPNITMLIDPDGQNQGPRT